MNEDLSENKSYNGLRVFLDEGGLLLELDLGDLLCLDVRLEMPRLDAIRDVHVTHVKVFDLRPKKQTILELSADEQTLPACSTDLANSLCVGVVCNWVVKKSKKRKWLTWADKPVQRDLCLLLSKCDTACSQERNRLEEDQSHNSSRRTDKLKPSVSSELRLFHNSHNRKFS